MENKDFLTIQGWMRTELNLKGSELLAYALIYGFTKDGESEFRGSSQYVAEWLGVSRDNARLVLARLTEKGYLIKRTEVVNGVAFCRYTTTKIVQGGDTKIVQGGDTKIVHNIDNIDIDNIDKDRSCKDARARTEYREGWEYNTTTDAEKEEKVAPKEESEVQTILSKYFPNVQSLPRPLSDDEYGKLVDKFGGQSVEDILGQMENYKELRKKYTSAYLTAHQWLSRERERKAAQNDRPRKSANGYRNPDPTAYKDNVL